MSRLAHCPPGVDQSLFPMNCQHPDFMKYCGIFYSYYFPLFKKRIQHIHFSTSSPVDISEFYSAANELFIRILELWDPSLSPFGAHLWLRLRNLSHINRDHYRFSDRNPHLSINTPINDSGATFCDIIPDSNQQEYIERPSIKDLSEKALICLMGSIKGQYLPDHLKDVVVPGKFDTYEAIHHDSRCSEEYSYSKGFYRIATSAKFFRHHMKDGWQRRECVDIWHEVSDWVNSGGVLN